MSSTVVTEQPDARGETPLFMRVAAALRAEMASGRLPAGGRLAPERELCRRLGVSRNTLRRALADLEALALVAPAGRNGWYVSAPPVEELARGPRSLTEWARATGHALSSRVVSCRVRAASAAETDALRRPRRGRVLAIERVRIVDGVPLSLDCACLPERLAVPLAGADLAGGSLYAALWERCGLVPGGRSSTLRAAAADGRTAGLLGVAPGAPLLVVRETVLDQHDRPLEHAVLANRGDRWRYRATQLAGEVEPAG